MCMIITPSALNFMRRMLRLGGNPASGFSLVATPGGCSGTSVEFGVEPAAPDGYVTMQYEGITIHMPPATQTLLKGCTLDFADTLHGTGFVVRDPKGGGCGCATDSGGAAVVDISRLRRGP